MKRNTELLLDASKEVCLEINTENTKYMFMSCHQTTGQNHYIKVANKYFESVTKFEYLGRMITNQNCIQKKLRAN
jgi:hypothetical protein